MQHPGFFDRAGPFTLAEIAAATGATLPPGAVPSRRLADVRALDSAGPDHLAFLDNKKYVPQLATTKAGACLVAPALAGQLPVGIVPLTSSAPYHAFAKSLQLFYPGAGHPRVAEHRPGARHEMISSSAEIEEGAIVEPGAVVGPEVRIGRGTVIAAGAVIGFRCTIGRGSFVGPNASVTHALVGDRVIIHGGVQIGQDGFGFAMGPAGHLKVPQIGRVIIQDDVEIGANTTIDRGALKDTIIGEGTKIDNLVQIGHNVVIGRHCVIVSQVGISGSVELGDFVVMAGKSGVLGHLKIGSGAQLAACAAVMSDVPAGARYGGCPAKDVKAWARELAMVKRMAVRGRKD